MLQGALYALVIAPAGLAGIIPPDSTKLGRPLGYADAHVSLYVTGGLVSGCTGPESGSSWTGSGSIEALKGKLLVEVRSEHFDLPGHVEYRTVRLGRMWHPNRRMVGGITVGYRSSPRLRAHEGLEIAFPFAGGGPNTWVRLESAYVMSLKQASWNYRLQMERRIAGGPFVVGLNIDLKSWEIRDHGELSHETFSILLGTALWR